MQWGRNVVFTTPLPKLFLTAQEGLLFPPRSRLIEQFINASSPFPESLTGPVDIGLARHYGQEDQPENIANVIIDWDRQTFRERP